MRKKYSTYKDSKFDCIGEIPNHWKIIRLASLGSFSKGKGISRDQVTKSGLPGIRYGEIYTSYDIVFKSTKSFIDYGVSNGFTTITKGDLLMVGDGETKEEIGKCVTYDGDEEVFVGGGINILKLFSEQSPLFLSFALSSNSAIFQKASSAKGEIIVHIYAKQLREIRIPLPPLPEQKAIARYLDQKTALIDDLIEKTTQKIALLQEQRTAIINQAVTKGLNPDVQTKDSGIEWIGEIPEHWKHSKLGFYTTKVGAGSTPRGGAEVYVEAGIPFIRSQNVHFDGLRLDNVSFISKEIHSTMSSTTVINNDVLLNITGGSIGRCCIVQIDEEMNVNQHVSIIRTTAKLLTSFLFFILSSDIGQAQVFYNISGGNREGLTIEGLKDFRITLPPLHEQIDIVQFLDQKTYEIDRLISKEERAIELLKEYRQSLISEVVTGKICVLDEMPEIAITFSP